MALIDSIETVILREGGPASLELDPIDDNAPEALDLSEECNAGGRSRSASAIRSTSATAAAYHRGQKKHQRSYPQ